MSRCAGCRRAERSTPLQQVRSVSPLDRSVIAPAGRLGAGEAAGRPAVRGPGPGRSLLTHPQALPRAPWIRRRRSVPLDAVATHERLARTFLGQCEMHGGWRDRSYEALRTCGRACGASEPADACGASEPVLARLRRVGTECDDARGEGAAVERFQERKDRQRTQERTKTGTEEVRKRSAAAAAHETPRAKQQRRGGGTRATPAGRRTGGRRCAGKNVFFRGCAGPLAAAARPQNGREMARQRRPIPGGCGVTVPVRRGVGQARKRACEAGEGKEMRRRCKECGGWGLCPH
jgi:hypothetical protein